MSVKNQSLRIKNQSGKIAFAILCSLLFALCSYSQIPYTTQPEKTETRSGNKQFNKGNYTDAEANYKKALDKKNNMPEATFNLGDAVYEQKRYDEAAKQFQLSAQINADKTIKAKAYHNLGNTYLEQQKWEEAAKAYKEALKNNSKDADTKYNLAYANAKLIQQKQDQQQNKDNKNKKDNKDKKDDKKDQEDKDNKDQKKDDRQSKNQDKKDDQKKQGQQPKLSKEEAEKILQAMQNEEQKTNQKVQQKQMKVVPIKIEKDW